MSNFTSPAILEILDNYCFRVVEPFQFYVGDSQYPDAIYTIPAGFVTDLASVPRSLWAILPPHGRYAKAAILHDFLICPQDAGISPSRLLPVSRENADMIFYQAMLVLGVPSGQAWVMYCAVRAYSVWKSINQWRIFP